MSATASSRRTVALVVVTCALLTLSPGPALAAAPEPVDAVGTDAAERAAAEGEATDLPAAEADPDGASEPISAPVSPVPDPQPEDAQTPGEIVPDAETPDAGQLAMLRVPAAPTKALPSVVDRHPGMQYTVSCDPVNRPGVVAFAGLLTTHYGKTRHHMSRACKAGDRSQHYDGRALDWTLNAYDAGDKAIADSVNAWLTANNGAIAKRFGLMYIIWNRKIWYVHRPGAWEAYSGPSPHTDHIHFSFTWDGAMKRTSWWTSVPVATPDQGTCRVYTGQYAPRYSGRRTSPCPTTSPAPPSPYPVYLPGAVHANIATAQASLGLTGPAVDGVFGSTTLSALLAHQRRLGLPVTGVLDNATWLSLDAVKPKPPFAQIVASRDVTADGRADVVAVDSVGRLHVYPGTGNGGFSRVRPFGLGWRDMEVHAPGDWDGDKVSDLVAVDGSGVLWLYPGDGRGGFGGRERIGHGWTGFRIVPAGDVDGNGTADLLAIDAAQRLWLYPGDGRGGFGARKAAGHGWGGFDLYSAGDMNRDGRADILSIDGAGVLWYYTGRGNGTFSQRVRAGHGWTGFTFASGADFNGDRLNDLMGRDQRGRLWFYAARGPARFAAKVQVGVGW